MPHDPEEDPELSLREAAVIALALMAGLAFVFVLVILCS
jgi:hypothetical protein